MLWAAWDMGGSGTRWDARPAPYSGGAYWLTRATASVMPIAGLPDRQSEQGPTGWPDTPRPRSARRSQHSQRASVPGVITPACPACFTVRCFHRARAHVSSPSSNFAQHWVPGRGLRASRASRVARGSAKWARVGHPLGPWSQSGERPDLAAMAGRAGVRPACGRSQHGQRSVSIQRRGNSRGRGAPISAGICRRASTSPRAARRASSQPSRTGTGRGRCALRGSPEDAEGPPRARWGPARA